MGDDTGDKSKFSVIKGGGEPGKRKVIALHSGLQSLQEACMEAISLGSETAIVGFAIVAVGANGEVVETFDADDRGSAARVIGHMEVTKAALLEEILEQDFEEDDETPDAGEDEEEGEDEPQAGDILVIAENDAAKDD